MGRGGRSGGDRLHGLDGGTMSGEGLGSMILTLVTFIPLAGAAAVICPEPRARYPRVLAGDFVACIRAVVAFAGTPSTCAGGLSVRGERSVDSNSEHSLPHGRGRNLHVAGCADHFPDHALCLDLVEVDSRAGKGIFYPAA